MDRSTFPSHALPGTTATLHQHEQPKHRAAIYARTSTTRQKLGYSIAEQVRQCVNRCLALNWTVAFVYRDEAKSGKNTDRPMFQKMLTQAEHGLIDVVVFWKIDRFSRSIMHAVQLEKQFRDWGVGLHSVTEQIDTTTPAGQFNFRNLANSAEFEREMIKQRTKMGHAARAMEGKWPNGSPPLGYEATPDGRLQIVQSEAKLVRWIFERYTETKSMPEVAKELDVNRKQDSIDKKWTPSLISAILRNTLYIGQYTVGDVERCENTYRIVSDELFEQTRTLRTRFESTESESRPSMGSKRKRTRVNRILNQYQNWIN
ncbi:recombinase family protein [Haloarcula sp. Atlit-7R]|uniref:recombinase family protein n=1 Tax=Haloarcula sp. Atlit-7R TaxID=2282125 RepID=UPI000EF1443D|nr:recombinase family protein [Haloarcula sp. Atlit-7R]RLM96980.1 recombinase family protein [Haloarcula sp. Atlit-7R]